MSDLKWLLAMGALLGIYLVGKEWYLRVLEQREIEDYFQSIGHEWWDDDDSDD